jgi:uncharacterized RDD family membrane protein YckC
MNEHEAASAPAANPYAPPEAQLADAAPAGVRRKLASRGNRLGAKMLDGVIIAVVLVVAGVAGAAATGGSSPASVNMTFVGLMILGGAGVAIINAVLLHRHGQTVGKKIVGIRIVRADGSRCGLRRVVFLRILPFSVAGFIPLAGPVVGLVDVVMIFGDDHRTLHDRLADTVVVTA